MKQMHSMRLFVSMIVSLLLTCTAIRAQERGYGVVESYGRGMVVVRTNQKSTGHWKIDSATRITGSIAPGDWVFVEVERSGHVSILRFEERPTAHSGVVKEIQGKILSVRSGSSTERWNLAETTIASGISASEIQVGDEVAVKVYKNHNLAEIRVIKHGIK